MDKIPIYTTLKSGLGSNQPERLGHCPVFPPQYNSDYLADYCYVFRDTIQKWLGQNSIVHHQTHPEQVPSPELGTVLCKTTIEPRKPRICFNARPMAGAMHRIPS